MTDLKPIRMRHEGARRRSLTVVAKTRLTPNYLSIAFTCDDMADFVSAGADDHIKLFIPGAPLENGKPAMRDYTPRAFDLARGELIVDFALHDEPGPATAWAIAAELGDTIEIGGPRGSVVIPGGYDWVWLVGDEAAIPAITRRLTEPGNSPVTVFVAVADACEQVPFATCAGQTVNWVHRPATSAADPAPLLAALDAAALPPGTGFIWIAAEAAVTKALRARLLERGHPQGQMKAAGYWTQGLADTTAKFD